MDLLRIGHGAWTVLTILDSNGDSKVLDLLEANGAPGERILADLQRFIPERGPPKNKEASKPLRDKILEFREPVTKGGTLRVLWFYDEGNVVVCANSELKKKDKTSATLIDAAIADRNRYLADKKLGRLTIKDLPKTDQEEEIP
jgi:hypothetical protein